MNYKRIYDEIINKAKSRGLNKKLLDGYFEKHHIIPRCLGGSNDKNNLVLLTGREHYLCHHLLCKIYKMNNGLFLAYHRMQSSNLKYFKRFKLTSIQYQNIKEQLSFIQSENTKGSKNPRFGKKLSESHLKILRELNIVHSEETKLKMRNSHLGIKKGPLTEEHKEKIRLSKLGKHLSEETKQKISISVSKTKRSKL